MENVKTYLHKQGHRESYIMTAIAHINTLADMFFLWQMQVIPRHVLDTPQTTELPSSNLDPQQLTVQNHVVRSMRERGMHYTTFFPTEHKENDSDITEPEDEFDTFDSQPNTVSQQSHSMTNSWTRPILVTGKPGCGKSHTVTSIVHTLP